MTENKHPKVQSRNEAFVDRTETRIWDEQASEDNPYIAESVLCHGYDLFELMEQCSFVDMFYLLFRGELPEPQDAKLLERLMIGLMNPGPRHPATRAAMNAGVGKTLPEHIIPIATTVMGGNHLGAGEIDGAMKFLRRSKKYNPEEHAKKILNQPAENERVAPGFGSRFGGIDLISQQMAEQLLNHSPPESLLHWGHQFSLCLNNKGIGWLATGLAAAVFSDLGFQPKVGASLFQLITAPGLAAHGLELANKPITAMPYIKDEDYVIEE
jgi:citrate synthase